MKLKSLFSFKANVIEPCSKLLSKFKKLKPSSIKVRPRKRSSRVRKKAVKFRKSLGFSQCRPKTKRSERTSRTRRKKTTATPVKKPVPKVRVAELMTVLFSLRKAKEIEDEDEAIHPVMADPTSVDKVPFPSPITPLFARVSGASSKKEESSRNSSASSKKEESSRNSSARSKKEESSEDIEDVEELCRSFERYLMEMVVEEGELKDLKDVEELLYCWRNLKSPIFIDLVCSFYGELCKDLFSLSKEA